MSKTIDISAKLTNERPVLKLAKDKIYEVDDRKNTILKFQQAVENEDVSDIKVIDNLIEMPLGKEAAEEINKMDLSMVGYQSIMIAIMAAIAGEEYEVAEKRFRNQAERD